MTVRILCSFSRIYSFIFIAWIFFSWFRIGPDSRLYSVQKFCEASTSWIMRPLQRVFKPVRIGEAAFDFTVLIPLLVLTVVVPAILGCSRLF